MFGVGRKLTHDVGSIADQVDGVLLALWSLGHAPIMRPVWGGVGTLMAANRTVHDKIAEYRKAAKQAEAYAKRSISQVNRDVYLCFAREWRSLADQLERDQISN